MVYTSYYAIARRFSKDSLVAISLYVPKNLNMPRYTKLAPTKQILQDWKHYGNVEQYIGDYYDQVLSKLNPDEVAEELDGKVLLCYEKAGQFCHRHIVAAWLEKAGHPCKEVY